MSATFRSTKGDIPDMDPSKLDMIVSLLTTFESNDLHTRNAINFKYDPKIDYVFLEILAIHNGMRIVDIIFGYDKEKIVNVCKHILDYFSEKDKKNG
jgi:hypothetical protein